MRREATYRACTCRMRPPAILGSGTTTCAAHSVTIRQHRHQGIQTAHGATRTAPPTSRSVSASRRQRKGGMGSAEHASDLADLARSRVPWPYVWGPFRRRGRTRQRIAPPSSDTCQPHDCVVHHPESLLRPFDSFIIHARVYAYA